MSEGLTSQEAADLRPATHNTMYDRNELKVLRTNEGLLDCNRPIVQESTCYTHGRLWFSNGRISVNPYWQQREVRLPGRGLSVLHHHT